MTTVASLASSHTSGFPVVGIGCSAGGLDAVEKFLMHVPQNSGMGFVIIQHLDPSRESHLPQLLSHITPMAVVQVNDAMMLQPDNVYVIPPNKDLSISNGILRPLDVAGPDHGRMPIDFFLRTLADDQLKNSVAVILSGMGSDGSRGVRAIKERGGLVLVQEPSSAKADNMPKSAIMTGLADIVSIPEEMPPRIASYTKYVPRVKPPKVETEAQSGLQQIIALLLERTGNDFSLYKTSTLYRRIERRMALHQLGKISQYVRYLRENPQELWTCCSGNC